MKNVMICILFTAILVLNCFEQKTENKTAVKKNQLPQEYKLGFHNGLRYGLFTPENYDPAKNYPLVLYLHGKTDTVSWNLDWYKDTVQKDNPCFVLTPKSIGPNSGWGSSWDEKHSRDMSKTLVVVDSLINKYSINTNRLYIFGVSMGGYGVFSVLDKEPGKFTAAYAVCGGGDKNKVEAMLNTPLWIFHGEVDDVVPVKYSRNIYKEILGLGGKKVRYTEYPGVKHNSWENVAREKTLYKWLFSQEKGMDHNTQPCVEKFSMNVSEKDSILFSWKAIPGSNKANEDIWYHKLFKNKELIAEIDGGKTQYKIKKSMNTAADFYLVSVNYLFKESEKAKALK